MNKLLCDHEQERLFRKKKGRVGDSHYLVIDEELKVSVGGGMSDAPFIFSYDRDEYSASIGGIAYVWSFDE